MFYVCSRGVKIAVYDPNPHGREPVLLLHGWPMTHDLFEYQTDLLIQSGYRPVLVDLRGFGKSDVPAVGYTYNDMAEDLHNVIQTLHLCGIILVGYGMGGGVALRYIRRHPGGGVKKLVLLAAGAPCWTERPGFPYGLPRQSATELIRLAMADRAAVCGSVHPSPVRQRTQRGLPPLVPGRGALRLLNGYHPERLHLPGRGWPGGPRLCACARRGLRGRTGRPRSRRPR